MDKLALMIQGYFMFVCLFVFISEDNIKLTFGFRLNILTCQWHNGSVVSSVTSQQEGPGFKSTSWVKPSCMEITYSPYGSMDLVRLLKRHPTIRLS